MLILPAIDLRGGRVVRLRYGDFDRETVYGENPLEFAARYREAGAEWLHLVDLDAARSGGGPSLGVVGRIARETGLKIQFGGGLRAESDVDRCLDAGAERAVVGTAAATDPAFLRRIASKHPDRIAAGIDGRGGRVAIRGWSEQTDISMLGLLEGLSESGVRYAVVTDIGRDGALAGANRGLYREALSIPGLRIIASGGVSDGEDVAALRDMGLYGAIVGRAFFEGRLDPREAIRIALGGADTDR